MKVLAFGASSSKKSINKQFASYAASQIDGADVELLDINDYELPLFSEDREVKLGKPALAQAFLDKIASADLLVISFAEHNGSYTAAYKNLFDWASRANPKVYQGKPVVLLATSPGPGGAGSVLAAATQSAPYFAGEVKASFSLPGFYDNFDPAAGELKDGELKDKLVSVLAKI